MEETILRVCVLVVSLLYVKDYAVIEEQNEVLITGMQERERLLQKEATKLEQEMHSLATELPHSNMEMSQSYGRLTERKREESDVQQILPNDKEKPEHQNPQEEDLDDLHQDLLIKGNQEKSKIDKTLLNIHNNVSQQLPNIDHSGFVIHEETLKDREESQMLDKQNTVVKTYERTSRMNQGDSPISQELRETEKASSQQSIDNNYIWYLWKVISLISMIRILRKFISSNSNTSGKPIPIIKGKKVCGALNISQISLPEPQVLSCFYDQCVKIPLNMYGEVCEFVEGFMDDLLETVREISIEEADMQIGDFIGIGSVYELWATGKIVVCDLYVPITAPSSYEFDVELCTEKKTASPDTVGFGQIKLMKVENSLNGCPCMDGNLNDEDTLCLLHPHVKTSKILINALNGPLCQENSAYLSKKQVVRWFRTTIKKAWREISHKYEFQLAYYNQIAPGALRVKFRSGKVMLFNITPVIQVKKSVYSKVYLVSYLPTTQYISDTLWPISFTSYENALLQHFSKTLPHNSCHIQCLQILSFLHKQQILLTGKCRLTSYHLKSALLHLLMYKPIEWKSEQLTHRLTDMLEFLEQRLQAKKFDHALVGNAFVPSDIGFPKEFNDTKPINIFLPLASDQDAYLKTVQHFQELVKNAPVLIQEYLSMKHWIR